MINVDIISQIQKVSLPDRIKIIEDILQSVRNEIIRDTQIVKPSFKRFKIRKFSLGEEVHVEREDLYSERS